MAPRAIVLDNEALRILQWAGLEEGAFETIAIPPCRCIRRCSATTPTPTPPGPSTAIPGW